MLETPSVVIVKIAGRVADTDLEAWRNFLEGLGSEGGLENQPTHWTVLDFCDVSNIGRQAGQVLIELLPQNVLLLNGPTAIKNMATSAGFSSQILEPKDVAVAAVAVNMNGISGMPGERRTS